MNTCTETCFSCGKDYQPDGWVGLCGRRCYNDLCLNGYSTSHANLVKYFLEFGDTGNIQMSDADRLYIENLRPAERAVYTAYKIPKLSKILEPLQVPEETPVNYSSIHYFVEMTKCTCAFCGTNAHPDGWTDLCSRRCFRGLRDLLEEFEQGTVAVPDKRVVDYFRKHPDEGGHYFGAHKIFTFLQTIS